VYKFRDFETDLSIKRFLGKARLNYKLTLNITRKRSQVCIVGKQPLLSNQKEQILGKIYKKPFFEKYFVEKNP